jgi:hypothetical protein
VIAKPVPPRHTGRFTKNDFAIDPDTPSATCPAGHTTTKLGWGLDHKRRRVPVLKFGNICDGCALRDRCTTNRLGRTVIVNLHEARLQAARAEQSRPAIKRKLRRRAVIERKLAEAKRHGAGKARYRGSRKVLLQQRLTAGLLNFKRLFVLGDGLRSPSLA